MGIDDRIQELEEKLQKTPVNKATEKERGRFKGQIADLKEKNSRNRKAQAIHPDMRSRRKEMLL